MQSVLKARLGLAVESWGGTSDHGRDSFCATPLAYPNPQEIEDGPFVFQAKFVAGANSAGAKWEKAILSACQQECRSILHRIASGIWSPPRHYVLLTNCPLTATVRAKVIAALSGVLPATKVSTQGAADLSSLLDSLPQLRRSFPELLGIRDIDGLLAECVHRSTLERSRLAVEEAKELVPVFVPTRAYLLALRRLRAHAFVVLDGPPEMGKTAIARMIALGRVLEGWQAIECRQSDDIFANYFSDSQQIFVADDAFGRTEFDPVLGRAWERDVSRVYQLLDRRHQLIWTTRRHILMRALRDMDLTGRAARFPSPGEVLVAAEDLSIEEKARILYRHSKAASLTAEQRGLVRKYAVPVVEDGHFTPERIRRLVSDLIPRYLTGAQISRLTAEAVRTLVLEAVRNPTARMIKAHRRLPEAHAWVLISLLDCGAPTRKHELKNRFLAIAPNASPASFEQAFDDLVGTFLKVSRGYIGSNVDHARWIHPSYRDLVIDELAASPDRQLRFIRSASLLGVRIAVSLSGGAEGERRFPLMSSGVCWETLSIRCQELSESSDSYSQVALLDILGGALAGEGLPLSQLARAQGVLRAVADGMRRRWESTTSRVPVAVFRAYHSAVSRLPDWQRPSVMESAWREACEEIQVELESTQDVDLDVVATWAGHVEILDRFYPERTVSDEYKETRADILQRLVDYASFMASSSIDTDDTDIIDGEVERLEQLAGQLEELDDSSATLKQVNRLRNQASSYRERRQYSQEDDIEPERDEVDGEHFDIEALFRDL